LRNGAIAPTAIHRSPLLGVFLSSFLLRCNVFVIFWVFPFFFCGLSHWSLFLFVLFVRGISRNAVVRFQPIILHVRDVNEFLSSMTDHPPPLQRNSTTV
jgi:hypothetical protein